MGTSFSWLESSSPRVLHHPTGIVCRSTGALIVEMYTTQPPFASIEPMAALFRIGQPTTDFRQVFPPGLLQPNSAPQTGQSPGCLVVLSHGRTMNRSFVPIPFAGTWFVDVILNLKAIAVLWSLWRENYSESLSDGSC